MASIISNIEMLIKANETCKFYYEIKSAKKSYQCLVQFLASVNRNLESDTEQQKIRKYVKTILLRTPHHPTSQKPNNRRPELQPRQ